jgi:hypothetical protein
MYVFLYARVHTSICMHVWLRLFLPLVDAIKVLLKVWQLSVCRSNLKLQDSMLIY